MRKIMMIFDNCSVWDHENNNKSLSESRSASIRYVSCIKICLLYSKLSTESTLLVKIIGKRFYHCVPLVQSSAKLSYSLILETKNQFLVTLISGHKLLTKSPPQSHNKWNIIPF